MLNFKELDPLLHSEQRLAIISLLAGVESANFVYIAVTKGFKNNMPETVCKITDKGLSALDAYVVALKSYLPKF